MEKYADLIRLAFYDQEFYPACLDRTGTDAILACPETGFQFVSSTGE